MKKLFQHLFFYALSAGCIVLFIRQVMISHITLNNHSWQAILAQGILFFLPIYLASLAWGLASSQSDFTRRIIYWGWQAMALFWLIPCMAGIISPLSGKMTSQDYLYILLLVGPFVFWCGFGAWQIHKNISFTNKFWAGHAAAFLLCASWFYWLS